MRIWRPLLTAALALSLGACCCPAPSADMDKAAKKASTDSKRTRAAVKENRENKKVRKVSARKLVAAYKKDKKAADRKYKGRKIETTAFVIEVAEGTFAESTLLLAADEFADPLDTGNIQCRVPEKLNEKALKVPVGAKVTVTADCDGYSFDWISLEECRFAIVE
jgi:hypothetical protein